MQTGNSLSGLQKERTKHCRLTFGRMFTRTTAIGLGLVTALATAQVPHASANYQTAKVAAKPGRTKIPKAGTPTTIKNRVATTLGNGITPAQPAVTPKPAPAAAIKPAVQPAVSTKGDCRVMPLGDSLTAFPDSYRGPLYRTLKDEGLKVDFVGSGQWEPAGGGDPDSEGHGGFRVGPDDGVDYQGKPTNLDFYIADWLKSARPNVILLNIGTNDLAAGGPLADAAAGKLQNLVTKIRQLAPEAYLVTSDIPPNANVAEISPPVKAVDDVAKKVGDGRDPKISFGETSKNLLAMGFTRAAHTSDGTHFTVEGGVLFAKAWYPKARAAMKAACGM
jgi:GDSL-like Lipase/Acylhydrolase family